MIGPWKKNELKDSNVYILSYIIIVTKFNYNSLVWFFSQDYSSVYVISFEYYKFKINIILFTEVLDWITIIFIFLKKYVGYKYIFFEC